MTLARPHRKLKSWETQQVWILFLQVYIPLQNLPAFVHSPEPSGCHFLSRVFVINERTGGLRVYSFLLEEEPSSFILNTISNIFIFHAVILLFASLFPCLFCVLYFSSLGFY